MPKLPAVAACSKSSRPLNSGFSSLVFVPLVDTALVRFHPCPPGLGRTHNRPSPSRSPCTHCRHMHTHTCTCTPDSSHVSMFGKKINQTLLTLPAPILIPFYLIINLAGPQLGYHSGHWISPPSCPLARATMSSSNS